MSSTLDAFREQRKAAEEVEARLVEVSELLVRLRTEVELLAGHKELRAVLQQEKSWLDRLNRTMIEARRWREEEVRRYWPGVFWRWIVAIVFAVASVGLAGASYARITQLHSAELADLRVRVEFGDAIAQRVATMTSTEKRQFDVLMKWRPASR